MTNGERLKNMPIGDLLKSIQDQAEQFDVCIMTLLPGGRLSCPWHNDCEKCLPEWLKAVKRYPDDIEHSDLVDEDGAELQTQSGDKMGKNQISFCNEFNALMEKYNITDVGSEYDKTIYFSSNGIKLKVNGYVPKTGIQVFTKRGCISTKSDERTGLEWDD